MLRSSDDKLRFKIAKTAHPQGFDGGLNYFIFSIGRTYGKWLDFLGEYDILPRRRPFYFFLCSRMRKLLIRLLATLSALTIGILVPSFVLAQSYDNLPDGCTPAYNYSPSTGQSCSTYSQTYLPAYQIPSPPVIHYWIPPEITATSIVGCSSVTLQGTVSARTAVTSAWFEVSTSVNALLSGPRTTTDTKSILRSEGNWSAVVSNLEPGVQYYYRAVVTLWNGRIFPGTIESFTFSPPSSCYYNYNNNYRYWNNRDRVMPYSMTHRQYYQYNQYNQYYQRQWNNGY